MTDIPSNIQWYYNFGDGWGMNIEACAVDNAEARRLVKRSDGFCGYSWMVDSILHHGEILNESQRKEKALQTI